MVSALKTFVEAEKALKTNTPQTQRTPGRSDEVKNNESGFTFKVSDRDRLERFLILGTDGGTYYVNEKNLTKNNAKFVISMIGSSERDVVDTLKNVALKNRAAKNSPSIFTLALLYTEGKDKTYLRASGVTGDVLRTSTHLFEFAEFIKNMGGWGRAKRNAIADWYTTKSPEKLAYQAVKYRQRDGWTHRDLFRLSHPTGVESHVGNFILGKEVEHKDDLIEGFERMQKADSVEGVLAIIGDSAYKGLPWETIPTQFLKDARVWKALFYNDAIGQTALLRNITRFAKIDAFKDLVFVGDVAKSLADSERITKGRIHPVAYANALGVYRNGQMRGNYFGSGVRDWNINAKIAGALEAGFYESFETIVPANKPTMIALDVSGSMSWNAPAGLVGMNCREASAVMAMVSLRTEPYTMVTAFANNLFELSISDKDSLDSVVKKISRLPFGGTDCAQPMIYAEKHGIDIDTFQVYTDNETGAGWVKPHQALVNYRQSRGRDARLAVVGMAATDFTIADPTDKGMMDFVGMDASAPKVLADFSAGRI